MWATPTVLFCRPSNARLLWRQSRATHREILARLPWRQPCAMRCKIKPGDIDVHCCTWTTLLCQPCLGRTCLQAAGSLLWLGTTMPGLYSENTSSSTKPACNILCYVRMLWDLPRLWTPRLLRLWADAAIPRNRWRLP